MATPPSAPSPPIRSHAASLRRLSADIARFRDPAVRAALARTPPRAAAPASSLSDASPAVLRAALLTARAAARSAEERVEEEASARRAAETAAAAEAAARVAAEEAAERGKVAAAAGVAALKEEVARLEKERLLLATDSSEKSRLLRRVGSSAGGDDGGVAGGGRGEAAAAAAAAAAAEVTRLREKVADGRAHIAAAADEHSAQLRARDARVESLRAELAQANEARTNDAKRLADMLRSGAENEAAARSEIVGRASELAARVRELAEARAARAKVDDRLFEAEREARRLRLRVDEMEKAQAGGGGQGDSRGGVCGSGDVAVTERLRAEVSQMSVWIRAISPDGKSVEDGLAILRSAAGASAETVAGCGTGTAGGTDPRTFPATVDARVLRGEQARQASEAAAAAQQQHKIALAQLNAKISELSKRAGDAEQKAARAVAERDEAKRASSRSQRLRQLLERKSAHLKLAMDEIEQGLEDDGSGRSGGGTGGSDQDGTLARMRARVVAAEEAGAEYKAAAETFEAELNEREAELRKACIEAAAAAVVAGRSDGVAATGGLVSDLRAQLLEALQAARKAESGRKEAEARAAALEKARAVDGPEGPDLEGREEELLDYDPAVLKVVRMKQGMLSAGGAAPAMSADRVAKRRRVESDKESRDGACDYDGKVELERRLHALERRNEELEKLSKVGERTKEVAKRKIDEVRQACCSLFGWSMRINGALYRLSSIYAERRDDELVFGVAENGGMALHENEYTRRIGEEVEQFTQKWKSIPGLLASVTMANFEKTTMAAGTMGTLTAGGGVF